MRRASILFIFFLTGISAQTLEWEEIPIKFQAQFLQFSTADTGWAHGNQVYMTTDGGETWNPLDNNFLMASSDGNICHKFVSICRNNIWILNHNRDTLFHSTNGGTTWNQYPTPGYYNIIEFYNGSHGIAATDTVLYWTDDSGRTWQKAQRDSLAKYIYIRSLQVSDSLHAWAAGYSTLAFDIGVTTYTDDGGRSWKTLGEADVLNAVFALDTMHIACAGLYAVDRKGSISVTKDGGKTWYYTLISEFAENVVFLNSKTGLVFGDGLVWKTTDGGETWTQIDGITNAINIARSETALYISLPGRLLKYEPVTNGNSTAPKIRYHTSSPIQKTINLRAVNNSMDNQHVRFDLQGREMHDTQHLNSGIYIERRPE